MAEYAKPLPTPDAVTRHFWDAAKAHRLAAQRCLACDTLFFYPREFCPACWSSRLEWEDLSGGGLLYASTIVRQPGNPAFNDDVPYLYAIVQLDEGPRIVTNVVEIDPEQAEIGMRLKVRFDDVTDDVTLPKFAPAS